MYLKEYIVDIGWRSQLLESAGLRVLDDAWEGPAPGSRQAWSVVIGDIVPTERIPIDGPKNYLLEVESKWAEIAESSGLFGKDNDFLVSVPGIGALDAGWARVLRGPSMRLAQEIVSQTASLNFLTMSVADGIVCAATTEEYDIWMINFALSGNS